MITVIDVSNVNGPVNWERVAQSRIRFAYLKASEGATFIDGMFHHNREHAAGHGIRTGAYHFARPDRNDPRPEAEHFARLVGTLHRLELRPVLDLEHGQPRHSYVQWARAWNHEVRRLLGVWPLFYSYGPYVNGMYVEKTIGAGLWLAAYGRNDGTDHGAVVPKPWHKWVLHQYTSTARIGGINGTVDVSHGPRLGPLLAHPVLGRLTVR